MISAALILAAEGAQDKNRNKKTQGGKGKAIGTPTRTLFTSRRAAFDAGNRYGLPDTLPLEWAAFEAAALAPKDPAELVRQIHELATRVAPETAESARAFAAANGTDVPRLLAALNRLRSLAESQDAAASNPTE